MPRKHKTMPEPVSLVENVQAERRINDIAMEVADQGVTVEEIVQLAVWLLENEMEIQLDVGREFNRPGKKAKSRAFMDAFDATYRIRAALVKTALAQLPRTFRKERE